MNKFDILFNCIILSYNPKDDITYILSTNKNEIDLIQLPLTKDILHNYSNNISKFIKDFFTIEMEEFELYPQLIKFHDPLLNNTTDNIINCIFGFFVTFTDKIKDNLFWVPFHPGVSKYSETILDVVRSIQ